MDRAHHRERSDMVPVAAVLPFFGLTFGLSWGIFVIFILAPNATAGLFGDVSSSHPLFMLAVYSPAIAALALVVWHGGWPGLMGFLARLLIWRAPGGWWLFLIVGLPVIFILGAALAGRTGALIPSSLGTIAFMLVLGPFEELGWRGFALPLLQRRMAPIGAGLVVGAIWAVWHVPAFLVSGTPQAAWGFLPFAVGTVAVSVLMTGLFNASRGSILLAALFHFQLNNPIWPDAQPWDTVLLVLAATIFVWLRQDRMFDRAAGQISVTGRPETAGGREDAWPR